MSKRKKPLTVRAKLDEDLDGVLEADLCRVVDGAHALEVARVEVQALVGLDELGQGRRRVLALAQVKQRLRLQRLALVRLSAVVVVCGAKGC